MKKMLLMATALIFAGSHVMAAEAADVALARTTLQGIVFRKLAANATATTLIDLQSQLSRTNPVAPYTSTTLDVLKAQLTALIADTTQTQNLRAIATSEYNTIKDW